MIQLSLTRNEVAILTQLLENCIADLRIEIRETDNYEYKQMLKERREALTKLYNALMKSREEMPLAE